MGSGSLFLRTRRSHGTIERRWVAAIRIPNGTRPTNACPHQHPSGDKHPCAEAAELLRQLQRIRAAEVPLDLRTLSVGAYLERWVARLGDAVRPATFRQHESIIRVHLAPAFTGLLTALRPSDVDDYLARKRLDPQTLRHHRATLRRALSDAERDGLVPRNVAALSRPPRMAHKERRYLGASEVRRLVETSRRERFWPIWTLLVATGLRLSEALGLLWSDLEPDQLHVRRQLTRVAGEWDRPEPKTDKSRRTVLLVPMAQDALREQRARQDADMGATPRPIDGLVFTTASGLPVHGTNVIPPFRRALEAASLPRVTLHDLRHSCATILLASGVALPVIAEILGHSSIRVTADLYAHIVPELRQDAARRLAEALS